jgi:hypothetical protein
LGFLQQIARFDNVPGSSRSQRVGPRGVLVTFFLSRFFTEDRCAE